MADCAICGRTSIIMKEKAKGKRAKTWGCGVKAKSLHTIRQRRWRAKNHYSRFKKKCCERCGFIPEDLCQLDVHHEDGDHSNNTISNLRTLCANCHRLITEKERLSLGAAFYLKEKNNRNVTQTIN